MGGGHFGVLSVLRPLDRNCAFEPGWVVRLGVPEGNSLLSLGLEEERGQICKVLTPKGPDMADLGDFQIRELDLLGVQPVAELAVDADQAVGRAAGDLIEVIQANL